MFNLSLINGMNSVRTLVGDLKPVATTICTDSRVYLEGQTFVAIAGDNFDAFDFVEQILEKNCKCYIFEYSDEKFEKVLTYSNQYPEVCFVACDSIPQFLAELSNRRIVEWKQNGGMVLGITGSNGKTTHKEMLFHLLDKVYPDEILATEGNLNNHFGVPFTILKIEDRHRYAIIEMGSNHPGEIGYLANIALPDAGIITNIGDSHLEFFETRDNVFTEKRALFDAIACSTSPKKYFVFNGEDHYLAKLEKYDWSMSFGSRESDIETQYSVGSISFKNITLTNGNLIGRHNFMNLAACYLLACRIIGHEHKLEEAASTFMPGMNRSEVLTRGRTQIFLDAYNANPSSIKVAISSIFEDGIFTPQDSLFVLGDMNELGESTEQLHKEVGEFCKIVKVQNIIFVGRCAPHYLAGWGSKALCFDTTEQLLEKWMEISRKYSQIFIKGSRTLQLESLADIKYYNE